MKFKELTNVTLVGSRTLRCKGIRDNGSVVELELRVPENQERGVNEYFDHILDNHDWQAIVDDFKKRAERYQIGQSHQIERQKNEAESHRLRDLFDQKAMLFKQPYIKDATPDVKSAIRRCPDHLTLSTISTSVFNKYLEDNKLSYSDYLDIIDEMNFSELA